MDKNIANIFGYIGSSLVSINLIPQIITMIKKRSGKNISYLTCSTNILACGFMLIYSWKNKLIPVIICNSLIMISSIIIISLKKYFNFVNKKNNLIELQLNNSKSINDKNLMEDNINKNLKNQLEFEQEFIYF